MHKYEYKDNSITFNGQTYPCIFVHMHGLKMSLSDKSLLLRSYDDTITQSDREAYYNRYAELLMYILNNYYNKEVESYSVKGVSFTREMWYKLRALVRDIKFVQWLYFKVFKRTYKGHGTKL